MKIYEWEMYHKEKTNSHKLLIIRIMSEQCPQADLATGAEEVRERMMAVLTGQQTGIDG